MREDLQKLVSIALVKADRGTASSVLAKQKFVTDRKLLG
jgi:hypothetical protein